MVHESYRIWACVVTERVRRECEASGSKCEGKVRKCEMMHDMKFVSALRREMPGK